MSKLATLRCRLPSHGIKQDETGTAVMEFGLIVTVFMTLLLGLFDLGQLVYSKALLDGAVQESARSASLEGGNADNADARVRRMLAISAPGVTIDSSRVSYAEFADIERPETWNDEDNSGDCNDGEVFTDENGNGQWDADIGSDGNGGASDIVIYTVIATYDPLFPNPFMPGGVEERRITSSTVKKNQPFDDQANYGSDAGTCD